MPGKLTTTTTAALPDPWPPRTQDLPLCKRCQNELAKVEVRNESLGWDCFSKYVHTKVIKRMESYKLRKHTTVENAPKLLIPVSGGPSSLALLHILNDYLRNHERRSSRDPFTLVVMTVDTAGYESNPVNLDKFEIISLAYAGHTFIEKKLSEVTCTFPEIGTDNGPEDNPRPTDVSTWLSRLPSASSRQDAVEILKTRLIVETAKDQGCDAVLWGDSTTSLAVKTMSAAAKGRGESVPLVLSEGLAPYGVEFRYPLRDILRTEIVSYTELGVPPLTRIIGPNPGPTQASASSKNTTIEDLMAQYFESVEDGYPSIISNVVKTSSKLNSTSFDQTQEKCSFCLLPKLLDRPVMQAQDKASVTDKDALATLCYGCTRMISG